MACLNLVGQDPKTNKAFVTNSTARLIHKEYENLMQAHQNGAATEFQIQKVWGLLQHLALKHKQIACRSHECIR
eukprot:2330440-Karenia_brevis.AAC.1